MCVSVFQKATQRIINLSVTGESITLHCQHILSLSVTQRNAIDLLSSTATLSKNSYAWRKKYFTQAKRMNQVHPGKIVMTDLKAFQLLGHAVRSILNNAQNTVNVSKVNTFNSLN